MLSITKNICLLILMISFNLLNVSAQEKKMDTDEENKKTIADTSFILRSLDSYIHEIDLINKGVEKLTDKNVIQLAADFKASCQDHYNLIKKIAGEKKYTDLAQNLINLKIENEGLEQKTIDFINPPIEKAQDLMYAPASKDKRQQNDLSDENNNFMFQQKKDTTAISNTTDVKESMDIQPEKKILAKPTNKGKTEKGNVESSSKTILTENYKKEEKIAKEKADINDAWLSSMKKSHESFIEILKKAQKNEIDTMLSKQIEELLKSENAHLLLIYKLMDKRVSEKK